ncbi:MAG TPA: polysaccharide deacetylase family protein [Kofleriaceae bacterium]|jgi:peptidoglycan/xylan/chitin deacetylase (PgdA/CDA1 family)|nr:polysaccharide deacetylase family protein [Kofleriaceae bacterium]
MNKRLVAANVMDMIGATRALLGLRRVAGSPWVPVVTFHRVLDPNQHAPYLFDDNVVDSTPDEFERHVQTISRYFTPISIRELALSMNGELLPKNPILVTFDDGYRDNFEVALPILKRHHVHAVFFIATEYLTRRRVFWWDRINYILKRSTRPRIRMTYPDDLDVPIANPAERRTAINLMLRVVKRRVGLDLEHFLRSLAVAADVTWNDQLDRELAEAALMTWDQVRELRGAGMDIQSHTRTHRVLNTLDAAQLREELDGSKADLEREMDEEILSISYPVGHGLRERDDVRFAVKAAGYKLGFTNATGTHLRRDGAPYDVSRIALDQGTPDALFRATLAAPFLFG